MITIGNKNFSDMNWWQKITAAVALPLILVSVLGLVAAILAIVAIVVPIAVVGALIIAIPIAIAKKIRCAVKGVLD